MPVAASVRMPCCRRLAYIGMVRGPMFEGTVGWSWPPKSTVLCRHFGPLSRSLQSRSSVTV
jgi:hypothetical protein